ncbi:hypothetical protein [Capnocytophaga leadbetteri]|uniref:hypothetical protein n=1 Tax=Capnocytophaga leadbetteri TaxID=327575 RepID=UPI0028D2D224|nr:hypothetical protein [Capnocytophaga leadbetteri]
MKYSFTLLMVILFLFSCELSKKDPSKIDNDEDGNENIHYSNEKDNQQENSEDTYKNYNDTITATRINNTKNGKILCTVYDSLSIINPKISNMKMYRTSGFFLNLSESVFEGDGLPDSFITASEKKKNSFPLDSKRRDFILKKAGIKETDSIFIYQIDTDSIMRFPVKNMKAKAYVNAYNEGDEQVDSFEYGLIVDNQDKSYKGSNGFNYTFVGQENPFQVGKKFEIKWKEIPQSKFPYKINPNLLAVRTDCFPFSKAYSFSKGNYNFYVQTFKKEMEITAYYVIIEDIQEKKIIFEKAYTYYEFEEELFPLNAEGVEDVDYYFHQWAGEILKGKPMVLYGFFGPAFGRDIIEFVSNKEPIIEVLIDNRH